MNVSLTIYPSLNLWLQESVNTIFDKALLHDDQVSNDGAEELKMKELYSSRSLHSNLRCYRVMMTSLKAACYYQSATFCAQQ